MLSLFIFLTLFVLFFHRAIVTKKLRWILLSVTTFNVFVLETIVYVFLLFQVTTFAAPALAGFQPLLDSFARRSMTASLERTIRSGEGLLLPDKTLGYRLRPGYTSGRYKVDREGFREMGTVSDKGEGEVMTILAGGGDETFGYGLDPAQTWVALLDRQLKGSRLVNLGIPGFQPSQSVHLLSVKGIPLNPDGMILHWEEESYQDWARSLEGYARDVPLWAGWTSVGMKTSVSAENSPVINPVQAMKEQIRENREWMAGDGPGRIWAWLGKLNTGLYMRRWFLTYQKEQNDSREASSEPTKMLDDFLRSARLKGIPVILIGDKRLHSDIHQRGHRFDSSLRFVPADSCARKEGRKTCSRAEVMEHQRRLAEALSKELATGFLNP